MKIQIPLQNRKNQTSQNHGGRNPLGNWRWAAILALLACLMAGRATAGTLTVTRFSFGSATPFNLSAEGDIDWAKWGSFAVTDFAQKAGVTHVIPNYTSIGPELPFSIGPAQGPLYLQSWVDGTVDKIQNGNQGGLGVNQTAGQSGFQLDIPASTTAQYLFLYAGRAGGGTYQLEASLSDGSATSVTNVASSSQSRFTIAFAANSGSQTLTIKYRGITGGSVRLFAAALASGATLPLSVAAPTLNSPITVQAGSTIGLLANPKGVDANATSASKFAYQWQVDGVNIPNGTNNPLNNIAVGSVGGHNYQVVVTNSVLGASVTSAPVALTVVAAVGTLSAAGVDLPALTPTPLDVNLTTEGVIDYAHWGTTGPGVYDTKANIIGDFTQIGSGTFAQFNSTITYTWTDATTANTAETAWNIGTGLPVTNGYVLNIPASSTSNRLAQIYVGAAGANMHLEASISDNNAPVFIDDPTIVNGTRRYSIAFQAASAGQTLNVRLTEPQRVTSSAASGGISLQSASLAPVPALSVSALTVSPTNTVLAGQPMTVSIPPLQPQGAPPFSYQWQRNTGTGYTNFGANASSVSYNAGSVGTESCQVVITGSQGTITSAPVTLTVSAATGIITLLTREAQGTYNLTAEGGIDWSHWGASATSAAFDQKATGGNKIGNYTEVGTGFGGTFGNAPGVYQWHDGTPTTASTNTTGIFNGGIGHGFELDIQAAQTNRVVHINVGSFSCIAHVEASLSDGSALQFIDESLPSGTSARYNIEFRAGSAGQTLIFKIWDINNSGGNVTLESVSMEAVPPLTASLPVIMPASTVAVGSTVQIQESATGLAPLHYQWRLDSGTGYTNIPSSDVSLLTTGVGAVGSKNYKVVVSDLTGSVTSAPVTLTVTAATSTLVASSTTVENGSTIDLNGEGVLDWAHWGLGSETGFDQRDMVTYPISGVAGNQITNYIPIGGGTYFGFGGSDTFNWTNGTPTATASTTSGIYVAGAGLGFEVDAAAASYERVLNIYVGVFFATMHFEAEMSDYSAPVFIDESYTGTFSVPLRRYSIRYSSPNPGAFLKVKYWQIVGGNCTLNAATLTYGNILLKAQPVGGGQLQVTWPLGTLLEAPAVTGPWTTNNATSPYTFTPTGSQKYFRAKIQ